jgi:hypothetical protein
MTMQIIRYVFILLLAAMILFGLYQCEELYFDRIEAIQKTVIE